MKTILFFDHTARLGGGEIALFNLVNALDPKRFKSVVLLGSEGKLYERLCQAGIETHLLLMDPAVGDIRKEALGTGAALSLRRGVKVLTYIGRLVRFIKHRGVDAVHCNSLKSDIMGGIAARIARVPVVWHVRDMIAPDYLPLRVAKLFRYLCNIIPNHIIANSAATLASLGDSPKTNRSVVHDGVPSIPERISSSASILPLVGMVGRISPWKGQHVFIEAARLVHQRYPHAKYQIIGAPLFGEEVYEGRIRRQVERLGLGKVVEFTGFREDVQRSMEQLEILVHASTTAEPFGQVVAEAMSLGKPVVATNAGGIPEIMEHHNTGLLVQPDDAAQMADAIEWLLKHPDQRRQMGAQGRTRISKNFRIRQTAQNVEQIHEKLCGNE